MSKRKPARCANGCAATAEPGFCICKACVDKITKFLEAEVKRLETKRRERTR